MKLAIWRNGNGSPYKFVDRKKIKILFLSWIGFYNIFVTFNPLGYPIFGYLIGKYTLGIFVKSIRKNEDPNGEV